MSMWRCPHCGTPQAESARCWVCRRSSTACGTCRHFRRSVAAQLGYCGLDRQRRPLRGDEIRACWEGRAVIPLDDGQRAAGAPDAARDASASVQPDRTAVRRLEFVPVDEAPKPPNPARQAGTRRPDPETDPAPDAVLPIVGLPAGSEPPWNLWGDVEP